ncbi:hypothetical protein [Nocardia rhamnosiphila]|uniref:WXG100 family type VII secretion target n=1 Tax=Nocardia rhamnosiphila TaxID=426716 RepID=A0ABV2WKR5_9NOCA
MTDPLWLDPDAMHASAAEFDQMADELAQMLAELRATSLREGESWGTDEPGKAFAESYVPTAEQGMAGFENLVDRVRALGAGLRAATGTYTDTDNAGSAQVRNYDPALYPDAGMNPAASISPALVAAANPADRTGVPTQQTTGAGQRPADDPIAAEAGQNAADGTQPDATTDADRAQPDEGPQSPQQPGSGEPGSPEPGTDPGVPEQEPQPPLHAPGAPAPVGAAAASPGAQPPRNSEASAPKAPEGSKPTAARTASAGSADTPWGRNSPGSPRSGAPIGATAPESQIPPRAVPPRTADRPPASAKPDAGPRRTPPSRKEAMAASPRRETDEAAMEILRDLAARRDLEIIGFETSGLAEQTAREIAEAVDAVLTEHPAILRGLEVADTGPLSRAENRSAEAVDSAVNSPQPPEPWIVLHVTATADPGVLIGRDRAGHVPVDSLLQQRPMYVTMLRELGQVLDLTGGLRARAEAQRALITEYLRISGAQGDTLGRIVSGYKSWRAELGDYCFDDRTFSPGRALAAGFAAVQLAGSEAPAAAKTLHRLLVAMARAALPGNR